MKGFTAVLSLYLLSLFLTMFFSLSFSLSLWRKWNKFDLVIHNFWSRFLGRVVAVARSLVLSLKMNRFSIKHSSTMQPFEVEQRKIPWHSFSCQINRIFRTKCRKTMTWWLFFSYLKSSHTHIALAVCVISMATIWLTTHYLN